MTPIHQLLRNLHIVAGCAVLALAVVPLVARKGANAHRRFGLAYSWVGRIVVTSGFVSACWAVFDTESFVGRTLSSGERDDIRFFFGILVVLALVAAAELERGLLAVGSSAAMPRRGLKALSFVLAGAAFTLFAAGLGKVLGGEIVHGVIWVGVGLLGQSIATTAWKFCSSNECHDHTVAVHLESMLSGVSAFATAAAVFGFRRVLDQGPLEGNLVSYLPWVIPAVMAEVATRYWRRRLETTGTDDSGSNVAVKAKP